jgi:hypothetical protein
LIAYGDPFGGTAKPFGMFRHAGGDISANLGAEPIRKAARRMVRFAADTNLRKRYIVPLADLASPIGLRSECGYTGELLACLLDRHHAAIALRTHELKAVKIAPERNDGPIGERHRVWKARKLLPKPVRMTGKEGARILHASPVGES